MRNPFETRRRSSNRFAVADEKLARGLSAIARGIGTSYDRLVVAARHFRVRGVARVSAELIGDGLTLATIAGTALLALALPAMESTKVDWRSQGDYAVTFLDRYGNEIGERGIRHIATVPLERMPDHLIQAVLATEDRRFFSHWGVDLFGTLRALVENLEANEVRQGGSSITQQLAKNLYLTSERTLERKIREAFIAVWLDARMSKEEILKLYLDRAYMGAGNFGVAAAAEFYFGKTVEALSLPEAAMLAGLFKAPARYAPHVNLPAARARANEVLTNMVQAGFVTEGQVIAARQHPANVIQHPETNTPDWFLDWAFEQVKATVRDGDRTLTVRTTVDTRLQQAAEDALEESLRQSGDAFKVRQGALVATDPDGAVRAIVGGRDYGESQFNRATSALRQPGSSFKPFVYAAAMMNGYQPDSVVPDAPLTIGNWSPQNYGGGYAGAVNLTTALVRSINTIPVRLAQAIGRDKVIDLAHRMGIRSDLPNTPSLPLGAAEVTVIEMAGAYSVFANGGFAAQPYAFTRIVDSRGETVFDRDAAPAPERILDEATTRDLNLMLSQVPERGTGTRAKLEGIRTAGKTGTTSAYRDAWFVGFTGNYVAAVWFGNDDYTPTARLTGGSLPAETWNRFMTVAHQGIVLKPIPFLELETPNPEPAVAAAPDAGNAGESMRMLSPAADERLRLIERRLRGEPDEVAGISGPTRIAGEGLGAAVDGDALR